jgi:hypothetical protein
MRLTGAALSSSAAGTSAPYRSKTDRIAVHNALLYPLGLFSYFLDELVFLLTRKVKVSIEYGLSLFFHLV